MGVQGHPDGWGSRKVGGRRSCPVAAAASSSSSLAGDRSKFLARHASSVAHESGDLRQRVLVAVESQVVVLLHGRLYLNDLL